MIHMAKIDVVRHEHISHITKLCILKFSKFNRCDIYGDLSVLNESRGNRVAK